MTSEMRWIFKEGDIPIAAFVHLEDAMILGVGGYDAPLYKASIWYGHCKVWDFVTDGVPRLTQTADAIAKCLARKREFLRGGK